MKLLPASCVLLALCFLTQCDGAKIRLKAWQECMIASNLTQDESAENIESDEMDLEDGLDYSQQNSVTLTQLTISPKSSIPGVLILNWEAQVDKDIQAPVMGQVSFFEKQGSSWMPQICPYPSCSILNACSVEPKLCKTKKGKYVVNNFRFPVNLQATSGDYSVRLLAFTKLQPLLCYRVEFTIQSSDEADSDEADSDEVDSDEVDSEEEFQVLDSIKDNAVFFIGMLLIIIFLALLVVISIKVRDISGSRVSYRVLN